VAVLAFYVEFWKLHYIEPSQKHAQFFNRPFFSKLFHVWSHTRKQYMRLINAGCW